MQLSAVAPANPAPIPQKAAPEATEAPAVPFEEALLRVQVKGKPAAEMPVQPIPVEEQALAEETAAEEPQAAVEPVPEIDEPVLAEVPAKANSEEIEEPDAEPAADPAMLLASMPNVPQAQVRQSPVEDTVDGGDTENGQDVKPLPMPVLHARASTPRRETTASADVPPADVTPIQAPESADAQARNNQQPTADEPLPAPDTRPSADTLTSSVKSEPLASSSADASPVAMPPAAPLDTRAPAPSIPTAPAIPTPPVPQEAAFAETNHPTMIDAIRAHALPDGGRMQIKLDPPQLGALEIHVEVRDGILTASFQTSSDEATRLLGHSLSQLKHSLESQGLSVDRLQVHQAPRDQQANSDPDRQDNPQRQQPHEQSSQQDQQRREMLRRLWRRVAGERDPLDLLA